MTFQLHEDDDLPDRTARASAVPIVAALWFAWFVAAALVLLWLAL